MRSYTELLTLDTFEDRFEYLKLDGAVGHDTFGHDRHLNQAFYNSYAWREARNYVIARDLGCDLGIEDRPIHDQLVVHHIVPITAQDILNAEERLVDPDNLITTTHQTHNALHYSGEAPSQPTLIIRTPGDTKLW